jgi:hypothetical protein
MGDLLNAIQSSTGTRKGGRGALERVLETLPESDRADLIEAINNQNIEATVISRVMQARGVSLPANAITRYRRGEAAYVVE